MKKNTEYKIRRLTQKQAKVLKAIISSPNGGIIVPGAYISNATGLRGNELGGTVSALERNDIIQPFGREGRQYNWELIDQDLIQAKKEDSDGLSTLLNRIVGEKK